MAASLFGNASLLRRRPSPQRLRRARGLRRERRRCHRCGRSGMELAAAVTDRNHDGISQPEELQPIDSSEISRIFLGYHWTGRRDASGNLFGYQGHVGVRDGTRVFYDVFFRMTTE